jgi:hypothetical protein
MSTGASCSSGSRPWSRRVYSSSVGGAAGITVAVWIYVDTNKEVGDVDHLKVFATAELADEWFKENDPEGVAFEYEVIEE